MPTPDIRYFAPSYKRAGLTSTDKVYPFVSLAVSEAEAPDYRAAGVTALTVMPHAVQGNISRVRNWILDTNQDADLIVMMDDDMKYIGRHYQSKLRKLSGEQLQTFCIDAWQMAIDANVYLVGLNTVDDKGSYREYTPFSFLAPVLGPFSAHRPNSLRYDESMPLKEDYDLFIQHCLAYRRVLRYNFMHYECSQSNLKGGCAVTRNQTREREQFELLLAKWGPGIVKQDATSLKAFDYNPIIRIPIPGI